MMSPECLSEELMGLRAAKEIREGMVVNLGGGLPLYCALYPPTDCDYWFHSENGVVGFGSVITDPEAADPKMINAGGQPIDRKPGMSLMDHTESFAMIRGGHIDLTILGAIEVSEQGDLANWLLPGNPKGMGTLGGAMDLATCAKRVVVLMKHTSRAGRPKIVRECRVPLTAPRCVDLIVTDIAVVEVTPDGLLLKEIAPGWTVSEVQKLTEPRLHIAEDLKEISF
jgi:3-oxoacid CoA-transferase B subunit